MVFQYVVSLRLDLLQFLKSFIKNFYETAKIIAKENYIKTIAIKLLMSSILRSKYSLVENKSEFHRELLRFYISSH